MSVPLRFRTLRAKAINHPYGIGFAPATAQVLPRIQTLRRLRASEPTLPSPRWKLERTLIFAAGVHRLAVRDDYALERKIKQLSQSRQYSLLMPRCRPDEEISSPLRQRIRKNERPLLGKP